MKFSPRRYYALTINTVSAALMVTLHELPRFNILQLRAASEDFDLNPGNNYFAVSKVIFINLLVNSIMIKSAVSSKLNPSFSSFLKFCCTVYLSHTLGLSKKN